MLLHLTMGYVYILRGNDKFFSIGHAIDMGELKGLIQVFNDMYKDPTISYTEHDDPENVVETIMCHLRSVGATGPWFPKGYALGGKDKCHYKAARKIAESLVT